MQESEINPLVAKVMMAREPGQIDMVEGVKNLLIEGGLGDKVEVFLKDDNVIYAADKNPNVQRFKLNTWLDTQYLSTRRQVAAERSLIVDHAAPEDWLENFKKYHIPFMKALGLPQSYDHFVGVVAENG